jgi:hypothetical protein
MASATEAGATFILKNGGGTTVFGPAAIGANQGSWGTFPDVYALDFDSVSTAGTYTIVVTGPIAATSPALPLIRGRTSTRRRWPTRFLTIRTAVTAPTSLLPRCARLPDI